MSQGSYQVIQVIIVLPIKREMSAAKKQCFLRFLYLSLPLRHSKSEVYK